MKKIVSGLVAAALISSFAVAKEVKIGVVMPMSGPIGAFGQYADKGLQLANELTPTLANGDTIKLVLVDNKSDKIESANGMQRLVSSDKVDAVIGALTSTNTMAITKIADDNKVPMVAPVATNPLVTQKRTFVSRACFNDNFQGVVAANYLFKDLGQKTVAIIVDSKSDYSIGLSNAFKKAYTKLGGKVLKKAIITAGDSDFKAILSNLKALKPQAVYMPLYSKEAVLIITQAAGLGFTPKFMGSDGLAGDKIFFEVGKDAINGTSNTDLFSADAPTTTAKAKEFFDAYNKKYNEQVHPFAALSADCYYMIVEGMNKCGAEDHECVNKTIRGLKGFEGASGVISIDENGDAVRSAVVNTVKDGKLVFEKTVNP